jgi:predicted nucleic acid-binding protein
VSGFLDTSVVVRYLTGHPPAMAAQAALIIDEVDNLEVSGVVLTETAYVLRSRYQVPRESIVDHLVAFVRKENIKTFALEKELVLLALIMCRPSGRVSFADAMIWAAARSGGGQIIYSFDQRFPTDGVEVRRRV